MLANDSKEILLWTLLHRVAVLGLLIIASRFQINFDTSAWLLMRLDSTASSSFTTSLSLLLTRWDTLHFVAQASPRALPLARYEAVSGLSPRAAVGGGLQYDYNFAFQPGIVWLLRWLGYCPWCSNADEEVWNPSQAIIMTTLLATAVSVVLPLMLYNLSLFQDRHFSRLVALLSILSPSPCTLITPTPESFFAFFSLLGHLALRSKSSYYISSTFAASFSFAIATAFRSNGILLAGFTLWASFWRQRFSRSRFQNLCAPIEVLACLLPLLSTQYFAWSRFCTFKDLQPSWCSGHIPSIYAFVQSSYWNNGFFQYWELGQTPNWIMAMPVLIVSGYWVNMQYQKGFVSIVRQTANLYEAKRQPHRNMSILAHTHYTLASLLLLVLASHVQISLRFASPGGMPALWWGAAFLVQQSNDSNKSDRGTLWSNLLVSYLVLWNVASIILFAGFYPPA